MSDAPDPSHADSLAEARNRIAELKMAAGALAAKARFAISPAIALVKLPQVAAAENEAAGKP